MNSLDIREMRQTSIPEINSTTGWQAHPINENNEPLVSCSELGLLGASFYGGWHDFSPYSPYEGNALEGALHGVYLRKGLGDAVLRAQDLLPDNMALLAVDVWRSNETQAALRTFFSRQLHQAKPSWDEETREAYGDTYVSKPSTDPAAPSPHNTGGTYDGWLIQLPPGYSRQDIQKFQVPTDFIIQHSQWLASGVPFDHGSEAAALRYYETHDTSYEDVIARENRRLMYWIMVGAGLQPYAPEFWEFSLGTQKSRLVSGSNQPACYGAVTLQPNQQNAEQSAIAFARNHKKMPTNFPLGAIIQPEFSS